MDVPVRESATGRCCLPHMSPARQLELLGGVPGDRQEFAATLQRGYSVSQDGFAGGSINIGAPVLDVDGSPLGALVISAPTERSDPAAIDRWGGLVSQAAAKLSHSAAMLDPAPGQQQDGTT
jgi:DNA-binding IclR family transcriptional regulator